jgi:hypothetical protein
MKKLYDQKGKEIHEFDVLKIFHYIGARRKKCYMYKWVRIIDGTLAGMHLTDGTGGYFWLKAIADKDEKLVNAEIVQSYWVESD